tara:strand:- start:610 stop:1527 length:918 start_codon:yes stop_codon:yes gene_type:complete
MSEKIPYGEVGFGYIDNEYVPLSEIRLPVMDLGFQLGDMCYDALQVYQGKFFRMDDHLDRFANSISKRQFNNLDKGRDDFKKILMNCAARTCIENLMVSIVVTRGIPESGLKDLRSCKNRLMVWAIPYYSVVTDEEMKNGCEIIIANTIRIPSASVDPKIKNYSRLDFVRSTLEAYESDSKHALLLDDNGNVTEGRGWNIFSFNEGKLFSPIEGVLEGITRKTVLELAEKLNIEASLTYLSREALESSTEVFLTSSAGGIIPVKSINGKNIGDGSPGPVTQHISKLYWDLHENESYVTPVKYIDC